MVQVIPLLVETGQGTAFDTVVVVDIDPATQLQRLIRRSGLSPAEAQSRIEAQASREQRLAVADEVVPNHGSVADLRAAVDALWQRLLEQSRSARAMTSCDEVSRAG